MVLEITIPKSSEASQRQVFCILQRQEESNAIVITLRNHRAGL